MGERAPSVSGSKKKYSVRRYSIANHEITASTCGITSTYTGLQLSAHAPAGYNVCFKELPNRGDCRCGMTRRE